MNLFEPTHLIIVAVIILLLFGGDKLPELMKNVGKGVGDLKRGIEEGKRQLTSALEEHEAEEIKFVPPSGSVGRDKDGEGSGAEHEGTVDHPASAASPPSEAGADKPSPES